MNATTENTTTVQAQEQESIGHSSAQVGIGIIGLLSPNVGGMAVSFIDSAMAAALIPPEEKLSPTAPLMEEI